MHFFTCLSQSWVHPSVCAECLPPLAVPRSRLVTESDRAYAIVTGVPWPRRQGSQTHHLFTNPCLKHIFKGKTFCNFYATVQKKYLHGTTCSSFLFYCNTAVFKLLLYKDIKIFH